MCHYTHLTPFEQDKDTFFLAEGKSITEIAHLLKRSKSTISRELRRNAAPVDQPMPYCPLTAQALCSAQKGAEACDVLLSRSAPSMGAGPMKTPMVFYGSSSRRARTSRIHQKITSNGSTMS